MYQMKKNKKPPVYTMGGFFERDALLSILVEYNHIFLCRSSSLEGTSKTIVCYTDLKSKSYAQED